LRAAWPDLRYWGDGDACIAVLTYALSIQISAIPVVGPNCRIDRNSGSAILFLRTASPIG